MLTSLVKSSTYILERGSPFDTSVSFVKSLSAWFCRKQCQACKERFLTESQQTEVGIFENKHGKNCTWRRTGFPYEKTGMLLKDKFSCLIDQQSMTLFFYYFYFSYNGTCPAANYYYNNEIIIVMLKLKRILGRGRIEWTDEEVCLNGKVLQGTLFLSFSNRGHTRESRRASNSEKINNENAKQNKAWLCSTDR